jgi:hypothetical protein
MRIDSKLATIALTAGLAVAGIAIPAQAATTGGTTTTFDITAGSLAITLPASASLAAVATGAATAGGALGAVTVADTRGAADNAWTTSVSATPFTSETAGVNGTVALADIDYSSGATTGHSGLGTFVPGSLTSGLATPGTAGSYTGDAGNSSTTWNPTLTFTLASSQVAGTYSGTITHSVA